MITNLLDLNNYPKYDICNKSLRKIKNLLGNY